MLPLNFNHLYYFYVVARRGSFSHAADELRVSQSAISVQIKQLEESLGHVLFNRVKSGVELTDSGLAVYSHADTVFHDIGRIRDELEAMDHEIKGQIAVGTVNSIGIYLLPPLLKQFHEAFPKVKVGIDFESPKELVDRVRRGRLDFAILTSNRRYDGLVNEPLRKNKLFLVAPPDHPLVDQATISPGDLEKYPFLGFDEGMESRMMTDALFRRMSLRIEYAMESSNAATIKHMAMAGLGLAILPETAVSSAIRERLLVRLSVPSLYMVQDVTLCYKESRPLTPSKREFVKVLKKGTSRRKAA